MHILHPGTVICKKKKKKKKKKKSKQASKQANKQNIKTKQKQNKTRDKNKNKTPKIPSKFCFLKIKFKLTQSVPEVRVSILY